MGNSIGKKNHIKSPVGIPIAFQKILYENHLQNPITIPIGISKS